MSYSFKTLLVNGCVDVTDKLMIVHPNIGTRQEKVLDTAKIRRDFPNSYSVKNFTVCLVHSGRVLVTPSTRNKLTCIEEAGLKFADFEVPFADGSFPADPLKMEKWMRLKHSASGANHRDYERDCSDWCDKRGIGTLNDDLKSRCIKVPRSGIPVSHLGVEWRIYPLCNERRADSKVLLRLGKYCSRDGKIIFVSREGYTYISKYCSLASDLERLGYKKDDLPVPLINGEIITDPKLARKWGRG
ncbi:hypothetical protein IKE98_01275 [Candidatus Saccharibacteria bacterium]|nr:hypothetical protein [Candidatus Saccharibacteria bacterium]